MSRWDGDAAAAAEYEALAQKTHAAIRALFPREDGRGLADHLNVDGSADRQIRPNPIFALTLPRRDGIEDGPDRWWGEDLSRAILETVVDRCVLPHGVTSLDPADPDWKGRHLDLDHYYYDAAYHNGDVWLWLSGPVIQALCDAGREIEAYALLSPLTADLMNHGAVGTLREIRDGERTRLEDYGGATSQAWSLAEYLRVFTEGFMGFRPRAMEREVDFVPRLPRQLANMAGRVRFGGQDWELRMTDRVFELIPLESDDEREGFATTRPALGSDRSGVRGDSVAPDSEARPETWTVNVLLPDGELHTRQVRIPGASPLNWYWSTARE